MATKINTNLFAKTESDAPKADPVKAQGVGLPVSEWAAFDAIAAEHNITKHALRVAAVRYFMAQYEAGAVEVKAEVIAGKVAATAKPKK